MDRLVIQESPPRCVAGAGEFDRKIPIEMTSKIAIVCESEKMQPIDESKLTSLENDFYQLWKRLSKCQEPIEHGYRFHPVRKWQFDFAFPEKMVAVEMEGGVFTKGGHTRGKHYTEDCDKYNEAQAMGWRVMRYTIKHLEQRPVQVIEQVRSLVLR